MLAAILLDYDGGMDKAQREVNDAEWCNPDNWAGIGPFKAYFGKRDSRVFVPCEDWWGSRTINFGHRRGMLYLVIFVLLAMAAVIGAAR